MQNQTEDSHVVSSGAWFVSRADPAPAATGGDQVLRRLGPPGTLRVGLGVAFRLPGLDQRINYLPGALDLLAARKRGMASRHDLAEHVLIRVREGRPGEPLVLQRHAGRHHLEPRSRALGADPERDPLVWLDAHHE